MIWFGKEVLFTPEIIEIKKGEPVRGKICAEGLSEVEIELENGTVLKAEKRLCEFL